MVSSRELVAALSQLKEDKTKRVKELSTAEKIKLESAAAIKRKELSDLEAEQKKLDKETEKENESIDKLKEEIERELINAHEEQQTFDVQRRILEWRGADTQSLRERLIKEGYQEHLVVKMLHLRTLEQRLEREGAMPISFTDTEQKRDPLDAVMRREAHLYDFTDRRVLDRLEDIRAVGVEKGYLNSQEQQFVQNTLYLGQRFEQDPSFREKDERNYIGRTSEVVESIRRQLGIDFDTGITYGGKKL